jgi:hypothetical protein
MAVFLRSLKTPEMYSPVKILGILRVMKKLFES